MKPRCHSSEAKIFLTITYEQLWCHSGGYGGFSDAMRWSFAVVLSWVWLACRGFDWGGARRSWKRRHSIMKGKCDVMMLSCWLVVGLIEEPWGAGREGIVSWKGKRERQSRVLKNSISFFFFKLCWRGKLWEFQKFRFYIYI